MSPAATRSAFGAVQLRDRKGLVLPALPWLDNFLESLRNDRTRATYRKSLQKLRRWEAEKGGFQDPASWTRLHIDSFVSSMDHLKASTAATYLAGVSAYLDFLCSIDYCGANPARVVSSRKAPSDSPCTALTLQESRDILAACDGSGLLATRDRMICTLLLVLGLRVGELAGIQFADFSSIQIKGETVNTVRIQRKGEKAQHMPLPGAALAAIETWKQRSGVTEGPLIRSLTRGREIKGSGLTPNAIWKRIRARAKQAGVRKGEVHPHLFRHTAITLALAEGVALHQVQDFAGHASPEMTRRYDSHRRSAQNATAWKLNDLINQPEPACGTTEKTPRREDSP